MMFYLRWVRQGFKRTVGTAADNIYVPKDRVTNKHKGHAFVEFKAEEDADYVRLPSLLHPIQVILSDSMLVSVSFPAGHKSPEHD